MHFLQLRLVDNVIILIQQTIKSMDINLDSFFYYICSFYISFLKKNDNSK